MPCDCHENVTPFGNLSYLPVAFILGLKEGKLRAKGMRKVSSGMAFSGEKK
jgi:hypothetical protein